MIRNPLPDPVEYLARRKFAYYRSIAEDYQPGARGGGVIPSYYREKCLEEIEAYQAELRAKPPEELRALYEEERAKERQEQQRVLPDEARELLDAIQKSKRQERYAPTAVRRERPQRELTDDEARELLDAMEWAVMEVKSGRALSVRLEKELLRFLRATRRRLDEIVIYNTVKKMAATGLSVQKESSQGETAFQAAAQKLAGMGFKSMKPDNVERIYRLTMKRGKADG